MQQALQPSELSKSTTPTTSSHPKIRPIIQKSSQENVLSHQELHRSLKLRSKTGKSFNFHQNQTQKSHVQVTKSAEETLKRQYSLSKFDCLFYSTWFQNAYFAAKLKNLSTLSSLRLQIFEDAPRAYYLQRLLKSTASLKNLAQMEFHYSCYSSKKFNVAGKIFKNLKSFRKLTGLSLFMYLSYNPIPKEISSLSSLAQLCHLKIDITSESENTLTPLTSVLPKLTSLEQIEVFLRNKTMQASDLTKLFMSFRDTKNLSHITLKLYDSHIIDESTIEVLSEGLDYLNASLIRKLDFNLAYSRRSESLARLAQALSRFTNLNIFRLNLGDEWRIEDQEDIIKLSSAIGSLKSLSSLNLDLSSVTTKGFLIEPVASALLSLKNLQLLKLTFPPRAESTKEHLEKLFANLKGLTCLQFLSLTLDFQPCLDDSALEILADSIKGLTSLRKLTLDFDTSKLITSIGVISICDAIKGFSQLSSLALNFTNNYEVDEEAVQKVFETLPSLPLLYNLILCFFGCSKLIEKEKSLRNIFESLRAAKKFVKGEFDISYCTSEKHANLFSHR